MTHRKSNRRRGMSLVEGMISTGVLIIGMIGAFQGIIFASQQNAVAGRLARATAMATQIRHSLERQGRNKMMQPAGLLGDGTKCVAPNAGHLPLTDGLSGAGLPGMCVVDLDVVDPLLGAADKIVSKYDFIEDYRAANGYYRRLLVLIPGPAVLPPLPANPDVVVVMISVKGEVGKKYVIRQPVTFYNAGATGVEL